MMVDHSDEFWEQYYATGHTQNHPWDKVVSFVFNHCPSNKPRSETVIGEVGFGTGPNLFFAAKEGFSVVGVEGSKSAVEFAKTRFEKASLRGDLRHGDFANLPFANDCIDMMIDRAALCCSPYSTVAQSISEIFRVLSPGGKFFFNAYSDSHSSLMSGRRGPENTQLELDRGAIAGMPRIGFLSFQQIMALFGNNFSLLRVVRIEETEFLGVDRSIHGEWVVIAEKPDWKQRSLGSAQQANQSPPSA